MVDRRALAAVVVTAVLWASSFVVIRDAGPHFRPGALAEGRLLSGAVALVAILLLRREGLPGRGAWPGITCSGLLWFGAYMVMLNWGEEQVDAGTAALLVNVGPILIALLGGWLLKEGFPPRLMAGLAVSFAGAAVVAFAGAGDGHSTLLGILLCLFAAITYAAGVVAQKPALRHGSALQVTTFGCVIGAVATLPFTGQLIADVRDAPLGSTLGMVYLGLFPTALAFYTWAYALSRTTAGRMGATSYAVPALVVLMSWLFLDEVPGPFALLGGLLCLTGVAVSRTGKRPEPAPAAIERG
ncbi:DMT family transporter [Actinokineospora auranticolor]|uniref:Drug/metabolite transporter (DMT)-like permease n=1 Tax=Actinokineospora auranticolor TaxID=155976 RepID=A0A2S6GGU7_9PSEU|nr:DMT family transporter [Actinokineospora auranticolor]PPK64454.1 drug/metabolite transporter (DMT)-like permease [Actinokineospora auranticolor]